MNFPSIDPIAFSFGPLAVRWYALAYLVGILGGWQWCMALARRKGSLVTPQLFDDFLVWAVLGVIAGGRLGYVFFYNTEHYLAAPLEVLKIWNGGMSFHGGMLGVIVAAYLFTLKRKISFFAFTDPLACVTPLGLGLGRFANFVNGELFGRETDMPWGVVFPRGGDMPRHPSQLYEALTEGLLLLAIMFFLSRLDRVRTCPGVLSGVFLSMYGIFRFGIEFFREPDPQLGFLLAGGTMGQWLCLPMILAGVMIVGWSLRNGGQHG